MSSLSSPFWNCFASTERTYRRILGLVNEALFVFTERWCIRKSCRGRHSCVFIFLCCPCRSRTPESTLAFPEWTTQALSISSVFWEYTVPPGRGSKSCQLHGVTPFRDLQRFSAKCLKQNIPYPKYTACRQRGSVLQLPMALLNIKMKQYSQNPCCVPPEYFDSISHHYASRL